MVANAWSFTIFIFEKKKYFSVFKLRKKQATMLDSKSLSSWCKEKEARWWHVPSHNLTFAQATGPCLLYLRHAWTLLLPNYLQPTLLRWVELTTCDFKSWHKHLIYISEYFKLQYIIFHNILYKLPLLGITCACRLSEPRGNIFN